MKTINTFGDSHAWHAWKDIPGVVWHTGGPMTMYAFGLLKPIFKHLVPKDSILCFCQGEVDCRCYVKKYQPWEETIDRIVKAYLEAIALNEDPENEIWLFNVPPPPRREEAGESSNYPFVGLNEERLNYVTRMNNLLRKSKYKFVDVYKKYSDAEGFLLMPLSDHHVHIEDPRHLIDWLKENGC